MSVRSRLLVSVTSLFFCVTMLAQSNNPVPLINQPLVPSSVVPGTRKFTLTINGTGFVPGSVVKWNGSPRVTSVLSGSSVQATINASDVAISGTGWVNVVNPSPGGGTSNVGYLFVRHPSPSVAMGFDPNFSVPGTNVVGDFNDDRQLDVAIVSSPKPKVVVVDVYPGKGKGEFDLPIETTIPNLFSVNGAALAADFNGDGNLDLAVPGKAGGSNKIAILLGDGHGNFSAKPSFSSYNSDLAAADFNGDGKLDLIADGPRDIEIWFGNGDGTFKFSQALRIHRTAAFALGDFDGDGALDFATAKVNTVRQNTVDVYLNDGFGNFQKPAIYTVQYPSNGVAAADVNGDGILDLVTGGVSVLLGNGDGTFRNNGGFQVSSGIVPIAADFNADGKVDIAVPAGNVTFVLLGNGDGTFQSPIATRGGGSSVSGDFLRNGSLDLIGPGFLLWQTEVNLLPTAMYFGGVNVGQSSQPLTATLTNAASNSVNINQISLGGTDPQDYSQQNNCPASLPVAESCQILVTFTPKTIGDRPASLSVSYQGHGSPQTISLDGSGLAVGTVSLTPSSLTYPVQLIRTKSKRQAATLTNTGTVDVAISSISTAAPFSQTNNCPTDLHPGSSCTIQVSFTPQKRGLVKGTLSVSDNAEGSPQTVSLSGTGMVVTVSPIGISFGEQKVGTTSSPVPVTLTNLGAEKLNISQITIKGSNAGDFAQTNDCGSSVPPQGQCTIQVTFTPSQKGQRSATLDVYDDGGGSPQAVALSGTGT